MLDFELMELEQLKKDHEALNSSRLVEMTRMMPSFGICFGPFHDIEVKDDKLKTFITYPSGLMPPRQTGERVLSADDLRALTDSVELWNVDDDHVPWLGGHTLYCSHRITIGQWSGQKGRNYYDWYKDATTVPASVARLFAILQALASTVQPVADKSAAQN